MKKYFLGIIVSVIAVQMAWAQVGIGTSTPNASSKLDVVSTSKGVLIPRMSHTQMTAITSPATGLQVYNTTQNCIYTYNGSAWTTEKKYLGQFVNAGVTVQLDNIKVRIPTSGNESIQLATVSGTIYISGSSVNNYYTGSAGSTGASSVQSAYVRQSDAFSTTFAYWESGLNFTKHASTQIIYLMDETNSKAYKISCIIGYNYNNNYIEIEQLL